MKNIKIYEGYKRSADFLLNFQMCRAYLGENCGVSRIVEIILLGKFGSEFDLNDPTSYKRFSDTIRNSQGKRNAIIEFKHFDFKESVEDILSKFVESKFDKMVAAIKVSLGNYPLKFRDIVERYS
jgi:hypothetical protein